MISIEDFPKIDEKTMENIKSQSCGAKVCINGIPYDFNGNLSLENKVILLWHLYKEIQEEIEKLKEDGMSSNNYEDLTNKPQINGVTLDGNKTAAELLLAKLSDIPTKLPNPKTLTFTGAVSSTYDGSNAVTVNIPSGSLTDDQQKLLNRIWIDENPSYTIASNKTDIFDVVENGKQEHITITDGSDYWDATPETVYPQTLSVKTIRKNRFYANMWLPNNMDVVSTYRYAVNKNGHIRIYDFKKQKTDLKGIGPWGICLRGNGKNYPTGECNFIISKFKVLGLNSESGKWSLIKECKPIAALYDVEVTSSEGTVLNVDRTILNDDMYSFIIRNSSSWTYNGDMCFHFYPEQSDYISASDIAAYDKILITFKIRVKEDENSNLFTCQCGCDAYGTSSDVEAFFSRSNAVTNILQEYNSNNCLENESDLINNNLIEINNLLY